MANKTAIISGITGQDGCYLAKLLLKNSYRVIGLARNKNSNLHGLDFLNITSEIELIEIDLEDKNAVKELLKNYKPHEVYNLAAQSSVGVSFASPIETIRFNIISTLNFLESIKEFDEHQIRFYQASSSEMFGKVDNLPVNEKTVIHPLSPYAVSKASAHWATVNYRESFNLFASCGILFNHESVLRRSNFFVKKVLNESIKISQGKVDVLKVGNIDVKRDFGYGPYYVEAMYLMLQQNSPGDFLICSGSSVKLRDIIEHVFNRLDISLDKIVIDESLYRPNDIEDMYGDNTKAKSELGWKYDLDYRQLIDLLLEEELKLFSQ